jgi:vancomycin resistance protein YoaR
VLADRLAGPAGAPLTLTAGGRSTVLAPASVGLRVDLDATLAEARSAGPLDRLRGLLGVRRDVDPVPRVLEAPLQAALQAFGTTVDRPVREGSVSFQGVRPVAVEPQPGQHLDVAGAVEAVRSAYLKRTVVALPVETRQPSTSSSQVAGALAAARSAVSAPVTVDVDGKPLTLKASDIAAGLTFPALKPRLDGVKVLDAVGSRLASVELAPRDATFDVSSGKPVLVPGRDGRTVPPADLSAALLAVLDRPAPRRTSVSLKVTPPRVTTARARTLGVREKISTFTTYHPCCAPRVTNIHAMADLLDGYVVLPGETFSLNGVVGRRDTARGFVSAPMILRGQFVNDVGGGVSQFTTTLFNAVFFAGLQDVQHTPHSYYISRYPAGRESTVSFPQPDFRFRDDAPTGVLMDTSYTDRSITVTFWGTRRYDVTSESGPRTRVTPYKTEYVDRPDCTPSKGAEGFDIVVTRVFHDLTGREVRRQPFKTRYLPEPHFVCGKPPTAHG